MMSTQERVASDQATPTHRSRAWLIGLGAAIVALAATANVSLLVGAADIGWRQVQAALFEHDPTDISHILVRSIRVPRLLVALAAGGCLAAAGGVMQAVTRNPLASPGILGINHGAGLFVVLAVFVFNVQSLAAFMWAGLAGAALAGVTISLLSIRGRIGVTPLRLILAGAAMSALLASLIAGLLIVNEQTFDQIRFWLAGSVAGRDAGLVLQAAPYLIAGLVGVLLLGRQLTLLSLGEDVARSLGQNTALIRILALAAVIVLAGGAVALAGPIGFVGLAVPHISRRLVGSAYERVIPISIVLGAWLLLAADILSRIVIAPEELPVGAVTTLFGAPFFVYLARKKAGAV